MDVPDLTGIKAIFVVVDLQEKASFSAAPPHEVVPERKKGMERLVPAIVDATNQVREGSGLVIWSKDADMGEFFGSVMPHPDDPVLLKQQYQSAASENIPFFENLKHQMDAMGKSLPIYLCGIWANRCVSATEEELHSMGFKTSILADLTMNLDGSLLSQKPAPGV